MKMLVTLIGLVLILEGLPYVASPESMQRWLRQLADMNPDTLRLLGIFAMAGGFLICFIALKTGIFS
jgi:uncharacterized protein YjeT (DUF2065 family)